jgi:predicted Ser/Thr protein kinase
MLEGLGQLVQERTLYEFLSIEPDNHFHDHAKFIEDVREEYLDRVNEEVRDSLELVAEDEYVRLFERYVMNVKAFVKREKLYQESTRSFEAPDERLMAQVEGILDVRGEAAAFRGGLIGRIGAWTVDHAGIEVDYQEAFPEYMSRLKEDFYRGRRKVIEQVSRHLLTVGTDEFDLLEPDVRDHVGRALDRMIARYGYCGRCAKEAIVHLIRRRYS